MNGLIRPKIKLDRAFMPVLITSNFTDDSIKNEQASMEQGYRNFVIQIGSLDRWRHRRHRNMRPDNLK